MENQENNKSKILIIYALIMIIVVLIISLICSVMGDRGDMGFRVEYAKCDTVYVKPDTNRDFSHMPTFGHQEDRYFFASFLCGGLVGNFTIRTTNSFFNLDSCCIEIKNMNNFKTIPVITNFYEFKNKTDFDNFRK